MSSLSTRLFRHIASRRPPTLFRFPRAFHTSPISFTTFQTAHETFTKNLSLPIPPPTTLRTLLYAISSSTDASTFATALRTWRTHNLPQDASDNILIIEKLISLRAWDVLLEILCDRPGYRTIPSPADVETLMKGFLGQIDLCESEEEKMKVLDNLYKSFAVLIYYSIPPQAAHYEYLVVGSLRVGTEEGKRRALVTVREAKSLGLQLSEGALKDMSGAEEVLKEL